ncbi:hypothetical protein DPX16_21766 [Anabarilius grahami]|uniref:Uncharacterized protein n=1 Tax=Anabarilius grahami TaxID=495550 RepID=A0A3N0YK01_ANAGA|nr:hypothetical protein DPX16_21766 [Anabarilius grahami]
MGKRKDLSEFDKGQIVMARRLGQSISKTAALVGCSRSAVPVEKNRDGTQAEIMFMDEIINFTVVRSRAGPSDVGAERDRWRDC